jgi:peptidoglycan lytic transglycosylase
LPTIAVMRPGFRITLLATAAAATLLINACGTRPPIRQPVVYQATGLASYYARGFNGYKTASGERYRSDKLTAAHPTLPFGTVVKVVRVSNGRTVVVRINDRGPFVKGRIIDLSYAAARKLGMLADGLAKVRVVEVRSKLK